MSKSKKHKALPAGSVIGQVKVTEDLSLITTSAYGITITYLPHPDMYGYCRLKYIDENGVELQKRIKYVNELLRPDGLSGDKK